MDPFSLTIGALGITDFALSGIKTLYRLINNLTETGNEVRAIRSSLERLSRPLHTLQTLSISDPVIPADIVKHLEDAGVAAAVNECGDACDKLRKGLEEWIQSPILGKLTPRDRIVIGIRKKKDFDTLKAKLQHCEVVVCLAVQTAQL